MRDYIALILTIRNMLGVHSPFAYGPINVNRNAAAFGIMRPAIRRVVGLTITKNWQRRHDGGASHRGARRVPDQEKPVSSV